MMQVKKCWQKVLNTVISIVAAMVFLAVGNCNVATANCGWSDVCEPGLNANGGSQVQGVMGYRVDGDNITPYITLRSILLNPAYSGGYQLPAGCYSNLNGEGYLITSISNASFTAPGHRTLTSSPQNGGGFRLSAVFGVPTTIYYNSINKYNLDPGVEYTLTASYSRKHICSVTPDYTIQAVNFKYSRPYEWSVSGQSYIGNRGRDGSGNAIDRKQGENAISNVRPGTILYWDHTLANNGPDAIPTSAIITANADIERGPDNGGRDWTFNSGAPWYDQTISNGNATGGRLIGSGSTFFVNHNQTIRIGRTTQAVTQEDVGHRLCQRVAWTWRAWNDSSWGHSNFACATVPYHYPGCTPGDPDCSDTPPDNPNPGGDCTQNGTCPNTEPEGGVDLTATPSKTTAMPGEEITFTYNIQNPTGPTKTKDINYRTYTFIIGGDRDLPDNYDHMSTYPIGWNYVACGGRDVPSSDTKYCAQGISGTTGSINPGNGNNYTGRYTIDGDWLGQPGDQICSYIAADNNWSVYNGTSSNSYAASNIACVEIGKKPQIQLNGSDSYAANGFQGLSDLSNIAINYNRGSYSQYGLLTNNGTITNFGSAGYTTIHYGSLACKLAYANNATFNNNCSLIGNGKLAHTLSVPTKPAGSLPDYPGSLGALATGTNFYYHNGDLTINGGSLNPNVRATIFVRGNVTINGNISSYNNNGSPSNGNPTTEDRTFSNLASIPSLTIVSENGNISVSGNVTLVDANLVATRGQFISCANSNGSSDLGINPSAKCTNKLKVNGSVVSKNSPKFHRTYGSGNTNSTDQWNNDMTSTTSEWFNYTPNAWLTPFLGGGTSINGYNTTTITSLPARY